MSLMDAELEQAIIALRTATAELRIMRSEYRQMDREILAKERRLAELRKDVDRLVDVAADPPTMTIASHQKA